MKAAVLVYKGGDGKIAAIAGESIIPLEKLAKRARVTGKINGKTVVEGVLLCSWKASRYRFKFQPEKPAAPVGPENTVDPEKTFDPEE